MQSVASLLLGPRRSGVPSGININDGGWLPRGGFLGVNHNPFRIGDYSYGNEAGDCLPVAIRVLASSMAYPKIALLIGIAVGTV